jgi:hypothetical protein
VAQNPGCEVEAMGESNWAWVGLLAGATGCTNQRRVPFKTNHDLVAPAWYGADDLLGKMR